MIVGEADLQRRIVGARRHEQGLGAGEQRILGDTRRAIGRTYRRERRNGEHRVPPPVANEEIVTQEIIATG